MPSRNSFSIRKLFVSPRRLSLIGDGTADERLNIKRRSNASSSSTTTTTSNSSSAGFHLGSSITTQQADRGLTANDDHELTQEEIDRIKAVVAAAAAAAANSFRLRMEEGNDDVRSKTALIVENDGADKPENTEKTATAETAEAADKTTPPRKKNRSIPQPIVVPRPPPSHGGARPAGAQAEEEDQGVDQQSGQRAQRGQQGSLPATPPSSLCCSCETLAPCLRAQPPVPVAGNSQGRLCSVDALQDDDDDDDDNEEDKRRDKQTAPSWPCPSSSSRPLSSLTSPHPSSSSTRTSVAPVLQLSKALPAPPPSRVSLYFAARGFIVGKEFSHAQAQSQVHPLYRSKNNQPDGKKDSGIALDCSQTNQTSLTSPASLASSVDEDDNDDPCLDLLQALSIQPEEAARLRDEERRQQRARHQHSPTATTMNANLSVPSFDVDSLVGDDEAAEARGNDGASAPDGSMTPTFTRPRRAPSPAAMSLASSLPATPPCTPPPSAAASPQPKKQTRFLPLRLKASNSAAARTASSVAALRIQRKRSKKSRKRERATASTTSPPLPASSYVGGGNSSNRNNGSSSSGGSWWTLSDNVAELFNGRLFSRMEVTETLPFEKLQAIRESRALAQKQQQERLQNEAQQEEKRRDEKLQEEKRLQENMRQQQDLLDAERELMKELEKGPEIDTQLETLLECEEETEETEVSPLEQEKQPEYEPKTHVPSPPARRPPPIPLPPPPHIATQMGWRPEGDKNTLLLNVADEPDGSTTPVEPFHMDDLPSRIGAAGVRVSILLPVEEEEAYFASSVAEQKERRREEQLRLREMEDQEKARADNPVADTEDTEDADDTMDTSKPPSPLDEAMAFPTPPTKNPLRFARAEKTRAPIPQVTVTDVDSQSQGPVVVANPRTPRSPWTPKASPPLIPSSSMATTPQRDDASYVYLPATPFSLVMPTYRHGPVRLSRPDPLEHKHHYSHHHRPRIAAVDETLDWTAFQMAILGGAGDFFQDSIDYGRSSSADADEADRLADWFCSLGFHHERLLKSEMEEETEPVWPVLSSQGRARTADTRAPPYTHHAPRTAGPQWTSVSSSINSSSSHTNYRCSHSRTTTSTSIGTTASGSCCSTDYNNNNSSSSLALPPANIAEMPASRTPPVSRNNSSANRNTPRTVEGRLRASCASFDSYESMPQSPMADMVMTRGADGKEYVAPMGYNLGHDLGDFLRWETENVYAMTLD